MTQKSPVYGIYIFTTGILFIICAAAGLLGPSVFFWGPLVSVIAAAILMAARRYLLMAGALLLGSAAALLTGGGASLVVLLTLLPTGIAIGLFTRFRQNQLVGMGAGAVVFTSTATASLFFLAKSANGSFSSESVSKLIGDFVDTYSAALKQVFESQNIKASEYSSFFETLKQNLSLHFLGITGAFGVIVSFIAAILAILIISLEKGDRVNAESFQLSRISGIAVVIIFLTDFASTGYPQLIAANLVMILTPVFFISGCVFIYTLIRKGTLFRSPFFFYGMLLCLFLLNIVPTFTCIGIYHALNINWSKLRPQDNDGDDF